MNRAEATRALSHDPDPASNPWYRRLRVSNWVKEEVACARCHAPVAARRATTINIQRHPAARDQILDGSFHRVTCGACGQVSQLDAHMLLSDFPRGQFVEVRPISEASNWSDHALATTAIFAEGIAQARALGIVGAPHIRLVYGLAGLADKLRAWDVGLDDRVIELAKLALVLEVGGGSTPASIQLVLTGDELVFVMTAADGTVEPHGLARSRYDELVASATRDPSSLGKLFDGPFVSWVRIYAP